MNDWGGYCLIVLINPNLLVLANDPFTTGIVYMPHNLAYAAAALRKINVPLKVIDAFGEQPKQGRMQGEFLFLGLTMPQIIERIPDGTEIVFVYAINLTNHLSTLAIVRAVRNHLKQGKIIIIENSQAVTGYPLNLVDKEFYEAGADFIFMGDPDERITLLTQQLLKGESVENIAGITGFGMGNASSERTYSHQDINMMPFPAWDLFPVENYWKLKCAHGPQTKAKYLPILTSRGCPFGCRFCVVPYTNNRDWRPRSAKNVVDEMEYFVNSLGVSEFHFEDLNPTVSEDRIIEICDQIMERRINVSWKLVSGTKIETIRNIDTIDRMARAGCRYISISPETGSERMLKLMNKPFNLQHAVQLVRRMNTVGIRSQACFIIGFPGEMEKDRLMTWNLVKDITKRGVDEIALFIITPVPGSSIYSELGGFKSLSQLNFSPTWREDFQMLNVFRLKLYLLFLLWKSFYHPLKVLKQCFNFLSRKFETKMEMVPFRAIRFRFMTRLVQD